MAVKPCRNHRCPHVVETKGYTSLGGYCPECWAKYAKTEPDPPLGQKPKLSAAKRGYGRKWQAASKRFLKANPFCANPYGHHEPFNLVTGEQYAASLVKATLVDHIKPHRGNMDLFWNESNWQPLCHGCHSFKTLVEGK